MAETSDTATFALPGAEQRLRCAGCGNLTRFDVVRRATTHEYWHQSLAGEATIEESETVEQTAVSVTCRWCGRSDAIQLVPRPGPGGE